MTPPARFISVTLNPAIDRTVALEELRLGEVVRGRLTYLEPAGKGVNVARTLAALGHDVTCTGFIGRGEAAWFARSLAEAGAGSALVHVAGVTRENLTYLERSGRETHIVEAGFEVRPSDVRRLRTRLAALLRPGDWVLLTGRPAPGFLPSDFRALVADLRERGAQVAVDSSGEFLQAAVEEAPEVIKPNREEPLSSSVRSCGARSDVVRAARGLAEKIRYVVVSLGAEGALGVTSEGAWHAQERPRVPAVSTVGGGDALLAGFTAGLAEGKGPVEALRLAVACGGRLRPPHRGRPACARRAEEVLGRVVVSRV